MRVCRVALDGRQAATDELADFFGESSDGGSDDGLQERRKVVKAINRSALASVNAARGDLRCLCPRQ